MHNGWSCSSTQCLEESSPNGKQIVPLYTSCSLALRVSPLSSAVTIQEILTQRVFLPPPSSGTKLSDGADGIIYLHEVPTSAVPNDLPV